MNLLSHPILILPMGKTRQSEVRENIGISNTLVSFLLNEIMHVYPSPVCGMWEMLCKYELGLTHSLDKYLLSAYHV